jgi:hypothetical protein
MHQSSACALADRLFCHLVFVLPLLTFAQISPEFPFHSRPSSSIIVHHLSRYRYSAPRRRVCRRPRCPRTAPPPRSSRITCATFSACSGSPTCRGPRPPPRPRPARTPTAGRTRCAQGMDANPCQ